jgi:hypothetical protein
MPQVIATAAKTPDCGAVKKERLAPPKTRQWVRVEDYVAALARRRAARHGRQGKERPRTEPEAPRFLLSTLPFLALIGALAILALAIMITAYPGSQPQPQPRQMAEREQGTAPKGWLQEAEKEFH